MPKMASKHKKEDTFKFINYSLNPHKMKKLFTLTLVMSMALAGFSQVTKMSKKDAMQPAPMQKAARIDNVNANAQSLPMMTRTDGELDYTTYDWQSNAAARTWTITWPDGKVNFAYTMATDQNFSDRGTGIGTYDANTDEWIPCEGRVEPERTGFGTIARYRQNSIIVAAHTATECGVYLVDDKDNITPGCATLLSHLDPTYDPCWPNVMTSGANRDIIHLLVTAYAADGEGTSVPGAEGVNNPIIYFRSTDGGLNWDKQNVVLPYMGTDGGLDWGSNVCYWMETTEDNCLAFVVSNAWSDCFVLYSYDDGETWAKKTFWQHPGITATYDTWFMYPRWTSAQWGQNGELCLVYEHNGTTGEPGSGSYYPAIGGVSFWSETMPYRSTEYAPFGYDPNNANPPVYGQPFVMDSAYVVEDINYSWPLWSGATHEEDGMLPEYFGFLPALTPEGDYESWEVATEFNIEDRSQHGAYNSGSVAMPVLCMHPNENGVMVAVWSCMDENNTDGTNFYYKLFASCSTDGGLTWCDMKQLTKDFMYQYMECVYSQATIVGNTLIVASQMDSETGTFVQSDDPDPTNNYYQGMTFDLLELFGLDAVDENYVANDIQMSVYPNPAVEQVNVTLSQNADIVIYNVQGQQVMNMEGHVGANSINISNLNAGIYFISAGSSTQKFIVK